MAKYSEILKHVIEEEKDAEATRPSPDGDQILTLDWAVVELPGNLL